MKTSEMYVQSVKKWKREKEINKVVSTFNWYDVTEIAANYHEYCINITKSTKPSKT